MLAALLITSPPDLRLVMLLSPMFTLPPSNLNSLPPIVKVAGPSFLIVLMLVKSPAKPNSTLAPSSVLDCFTVKFLPAAISTVLPSVIVFAVVAESAVVLPVDFTFHTDCAAPGATCKSYVTWLPFSVLLTVTELSLEVTTVRASFNCFTLTASVSFTPAFTLVMFKLPALIPVLVTDGPPVIVKPPLLRIVSPIFREPFGVKSTSLDNAYV